LTHHGYVLYVARLVPENTVEPFLTAAERLCADWPVVIVGSSGSGGPLDARVAALARRQPNIHWLGQVADDARLNSLWQHAGAYFHGHSVGGTNPALVQAMALGAPIVARDTVFTREVLGDGAGRFVQPRADVIASELRQVLSSPSLQESMSAAATQRAAEHYTWAGVCAAYETALRRVCGRKAGRR
jgi:glycosyltransferase involved in cell wall biosynthesis